MKVYKDLSAIGDIKNAVITIGSYDGVHTGHQKILERVTQLAKEVDGESVLITFHPHPRLVLNPTNNDLRLLSSVDEKVEYVQEMGIQHLVFAPFSKEFAQLSPEAYVQDFLVKYFKPSRIVIGYDHKFGKGRTGDINFLRANEDKYGYKVEEIVPQEVDDIVVSSTKIRNAIKAGKVTIANELLNHYFSLTGVVEKGLSLGREIGFPTANIKVKDPYKIVPGGGIYAVYVHHDGERYDGMLYLGQRPTLEDHNNYVCEVNIFDFNKEIYGDTLKIDFVRRVRDDEKFPGLEQLKQQLIKDKANTLAVLDQVEQQQKIEANTKKQPLVAVAILNYNGRNFLKDFLPHVLHATYDNLKVVVIDNASVDGSSIFVQNSFPEVQLVQLKENLGFAGGYNEGLKKVEADYFVLLNSDVEPDKGFIEPIIDLMERDKTVGACQPKIMDYNNRASFEYAGASGGWIDTLGYPFCRGRIFNTLEEDKGQYDISQEVFWASGAAMFVRSELFNALGGFDERFFAHMEEIDFCWRLKRAGYKVMAKPKSVVYHVGGGTLEVSPFKTYLNFRNNLAMIYKNEDRKKLWWVIPTRLVLDGVAGVQFLFQGKFKHIRSIVDAHWHFFGNMSKHRARSYEDAEAIEKISIGKFDTQGYYPKSILTQYFLKGKKTFKQL